MSTKSPKQQIQRSHKLACLLYLTAETLQEMESVNEVAENYIQDCKKLQQTTEEILEKLFSYKQVRSSSYLIDLTNKVDTVVRKNYQQIKM